MVEIIGIDTWAGVALYFVAISFITGSSITTGSLGSIPIRVGEPRGA